MAARAQNYIWRKSVSPAWLLGNKRQLEEEIGGNCALVAHPGAARVQLESFCETRAGAERLRKRFGGKSEKLPRAWLKQFLRVKNTRPIRIGSRLTVCNVGGALAPRRSRHKGPSHTLMIPAGAAFGTGEHATTAMSLRLLERVSRKLPRGWRMLDAGTGSGILALAASRFGAGKIVAIDHDPLAIATAKENVRLNGVQSIRFISGDVRRPWHARFDLITANLCSELLAEMLPRFAKSLTPKGRLILSGVLRQQEAELARSLGSHGFGIQEIRRRGKWIALLAQR